MIPQLMEALKEPIATYVHQHPREVSQFESEDGIERYLDMVQCWMRMMEDRRSSFQRDPDEVRHTITEGTTNEEYHRLLRECGYFWTEQYESTRSDAYIG